MMFKYLLYILLILLKTTFAYAEIVNDIKVSGNDRVSKETVILFSDIKKGDDIDNSTLNKSLKNLYETNFFDDVKLSFENQILLITVKELPVIQEIVINGIKRKATVQEIKELISLKDKNPFNKAQIKSDLNLILNLFKQSGYYLVDAKVEVVDNNNGTVNIVYNIDRGERASITKIEFIGDKKYKNRDQFFPAFILDQRKDNSFFQILRKTKKQFYWLGNPWAFCQTNNYIKCINSEQTYKFITKIKTFYYDSAFFYFFNIFTHKGEKIEYINFITNFDREFKDNEIYLIHVLSPHPPYVFNKNCDVIDTISRYHSPNEAMIHYSNAYNCLLEIINKLSKSIDTFNENNMVFVLGDHGWSFDDKIMNEFSVDPEESRFKPFFSYKVPSRCNQIVAPGSIVNILRFALICAGNKEITYLENMKFKTFYESQTENFGKVFKID